MLRLSAGESVHRGNYSRHQILRATLNPGPDRLLQPLVAELLHLRIHGLGNAVGERRQQVAVSQSEARLLVARLAREPQRDPSWPKPLDRPALPEQKRRVMSRIDVSEH